jgi:hypothetical protein
MSLTFFWNLMEPRGNGKDKIGLYIMAGIRLRIAIQSRGKSGGCAMSPAIEYERLKTGIVDFNLSITEDPSPGARGGDGLNGFLSECFLGPRDNQNTVVESNWRVHYRE